MEEDKLIEDLIYHRWPYRIIEGEKAIALRDPLMNFWFYSADSMAWSLAAKHGGRDANHWHKLIKFSRNTSLATGLQHREDENEKTGKRDVSPPFLISVL